MVDKAVGNLGPAYLDNIIALWQFIILSLRCGQNWLLLVPRGIKIFPVLGSSYTYVFISAWMRPLLFTG